MKYNAKRIEKFVGKLIKMWFCDSEDHRHALVGKIHKINENSILFDVNNEGEIIEILYERIKYILFK